MNWINSWGNGARQWDKIAVETRIFGLTIFEFRTDLSARKIRVIVLNFGFEYTK